MTEKPLDAAGGGAPTLRTYDEVPYRSHAVADTHPDRMAAMAALFGLEARSPERCRVLELGCARGDNLMAMATTLPESAFVGLDGSATQIQEGESRRVRAGLENVRLVAADFSEVAEDLGEFDYVVCHGVYSWLPPELSDLVLRLCRRHLAPAGIAFVSYNTYPGWHARGMIRDLIRYHVRALTNPREQIEQARSFVRFLAQFAREERGTYRALFRELSDSFDEAEDHYIFHEYLELHNRPSSFTEFAEHALSCGLKYVGPASFSSWDNSLPDEVVAALAGIGSRVVREQYLDFLSNRTFRQSLLARADVPVADVPDPRVVPALFTSGRAMPAGRHPHALSDAPEEFATEANDRITTTRPFVKAVFLELARSSPGFVAFGELERRARALVLVDRGAGAAAAGESARDDLAEILLRAALSNIVRFSRRSPPYCAVVPEYPRASPLARIQASEDVWITNLLHRIVRLDEVDRFVLVRCDGTLNRDGLAALFASAALRGEFVLNDPDGAPVSDPEKVRGAAADAVSASLDRIAARAFLMV